MRARLILAIVDAVSCSTVGHSQTLDERVARQVLEALQGTISVEAKPQFAEGQLFGCTVEFNAIERDWIYKQGAHIRIAGVSHFIPSSAAQLLDLLAVPATQRHFSELGGARGIAPGAKLPPPVPVFPRYVDSEASAQA